MGQQNEAKSDNFYLQYILLDRNIVQEFSFFKINTFTLKKNQVSCKCVYLDNAFPQGFHETIFCLFFEIFVVFVFMRLCNCQKKVAKTKL